MGWILSLLLAGLMLGILLLSGWMHARRGIGRLSFLPWDYIMNDTAIAFIGLLGRMAILWRDGWPLQMPPP
jgi:hypothetical protein